MSAEFSNVYQEILLDNLMSIIKQNFIFQTQLKMTENVGKQKAELEAKYNELVVSISSMQNKLEEAERVKSIAQSNDSAHQEKQRIQAALNDTMKKNTGLIKKLEEKELEVNKLKEYITKLEEIAPISKLKKINPEKAIETPKLTEEPAPSNLFAIKANDGSSF
jgi:predicted RNase H-like nuclease (RuvC/YqgF family)